MVDGWSTRSRSTSSYGLLEREPWPRWSISRRAFATSSAAGRGAAPRNSSITWAYVVWTMASSAWRAGPTGRGRCCAAVRGSRTSGSFATCACNQHRDGVVELGSRRARRARARLPLPLAEASKLGDELHEAIRKLHWSYLRAATSHPSFAQSAIAQRETGSRAAGWPARRRRQGKAVLYDPVISKEGLLDVTGESTRGTPKRRLRRNPSAP
jgi:hypothetical protein